MKTLLFALAAVLAIGCMTIAPSANAARPFKGLFQEEEAGPFSEIKLTAMRHLLNFRNETPLSKEQKTQVREILKSHRAEIKAQFEKGREARQLMQKAMKEKGDNDKAVESAAEAIGHVAKDGALLRAKITEKIRPLLSEEQIEPIEAARAEIDPLISRLLEEPAQ